MKDIIERDFAFYPIQNSGKVDSVLNHELSLIYKKKIENRPFVIRTIENIITKKDDIFRIPKQGKSICLIGHSQLDQWDVKEIYGYKVRNCAVSGITSFEYNAKILKSNKLNCESDMFLVMHGTNDIVWNYTIAEITESINQTITYIRKRNNHAAIIFLSCMHVNGRLDRSNERIDMLNSELHARLKDVIWIDTDFMNDEFGNLNSKFTTDGLHISNEGYFILKTEIENIIKEYVS